jgi:hypothetical protein
MLSRIDKDFVPHFIQSLGRSQGIMRKADSVLKAYREFTKLRSDVVSELDRVGSKLQMSVNKPKAGYG